MASNIISAISNPTKIGKDISISPLIVTLFAWCRPATVTGNVVPIVMELLYHLKLLTLFVTERKTFCQKSWTSVWMVVLTRSTILHNYRPTLARSLTIWWLTSRSLALMFKRYVLPLVDHGIEQVQDRMGMLRHGHYRSLRTLPTLFMLGKQ